jgi:hypothetical protein
LGTVASAIYSGDSSGYKATITLSEGAYDRFFTGQRVDILDPALTGEDMAVRHNEVGGVYKDVYVEWVDDIEGKVGLISLGDILKTGDLDAGDVIVYANSSALASGGATAGAMTGIAGINSWVRSTGNLLGTEATGVDAGGRIDVDQHPEFKSFFKSGVGVLTEHKLRQYLRRFHVAKHKYGQSIDSLVASDGVWLSYEAQKIGQYQIDRTSNLSTLQNEGSSDGFAFTFEGKTYKGHTSNYVEDGSVYGWKTSGNNWKRYVPPEYSGLQSMGEMPQHIPFKFVVPALTGGSSVKYPITNNNTGMLTEAVQMPGMLRMQLIPDQPAGLKLTGVTTDTVYGD